DGGRRLLRGDALLGGRAATRLRHGTTAAGPPPAPHRCRPAADLPPLPRGRPSAAPIPAERWSARSAHRVADGRIGQLSDAPHPDRRRRCRLRCPRGTASTQGGSMSLQHRFRRLILGATLASLATLSIAGAAAAHECYNASRSAKADANAAT